MMINKYDPANNLYYYDPEPLNPVADPSDPPPPEPVYQEPVYSPSPDMPPITDDYDFFDFYSNEEEYQYEDEVIYDPLGASDYLNELAASEETYSNSAKNAVHEAFLEQLYNWAIESAIANGADPRDSPIPMEYRFGLEARMGEAHYEQKLEAIVTSPKRIRRLVRLQTLLPELDTWRQLKSMSTREIPMLLSAPTASWKDTICASLWALICSLFPDYGRLIQ